MVLTVSFVLSPVTGLDCHRHQRIKVSSAPGRVDSASANLTPASGRQDHTTSPYAAIVSRPRAVDRSQIFRPALRSHRAQNAAASTASHPASVTIAIRPSVGWDGGVIELILARPKAEYFSNPGWTLICPTGCLRVKALPSSAIDLPSAAPSLPELSNLKSSFAGPS